MTDIVERLRSQATSEHSIFARAAAEIARLTPYVEAFRREEARADKLAGEVDDLRSELQQAQGQVEKLTTALDNSQSLLAMLDHLGTAFAQRGITTTDWDNEDLTKLLAEQITENRSVLPSTKLQGNGR